MGWRPWEVYKCTVAEFAAVYNGWLSAHCGAPSDGESDIVLPDELAALQDFVAGKYGATDGGQ